MRRFKITFQDKDGEIMDFYFNCGKKSDVFDFVRCIIQFCNTSFRFKQLISITRVED